MMNKIELDKSILANEDSCANEAFKALRTNVLFCEDDMKVICFTSATPNEGKSTVSLNLAVSMAELGKRVLYIDADLRKSVVKREHNIKNVSDGLSHFLLGEKKLDEVVCSTNVPNLSMVLAGAVSSNSLELLSGKHFKSLLNNLRKIYDYVFIDTPPMGSVVDASIVARESDGLILVIASNTVGHKLEQKVLNDLKKTHCKILGAVLNKVNMKESEYNNKYYEEYYEYYGETTEEN